MSIAPLWSLRSFWAAGGAPGALVRRDALLRDRLERIAGSPPNQGALTDERPFAALLQSINLNAVLPSDVTERAAPVDVASARERRPSHAATTSGKEVGRPRFDTSRPAGERVARELSITSGHEQSLKTGETNDRRAFAPPTRLSHVSEGKGDPSAETARPDERDFDAPRPNPRPLAPFPNSAAPLRGRSVPPVARDGVEQRAVAIARILAAADPALAPRVEASAHPGHTPPAPSPLDQLAKTVQRAERRLAEQRSTAASRVSPPVSSYRQPASDRGRGRQGDDWMPVDGAAHAEMHDASPRPTGIRGLALRTFETPSTTRAPLFGLIPTGSVEWPVSDIDQLSSALDDAARRDGIDFGELDA